MTGRGIAGVATGGTPGRLGERHAWMSLADFCAELGVAANTAYKWSSSGPDSGRFPRFRNCQTAASGSVVTGSRNGSTGSDRRPEQPWRPQSFQAFRITKRMREVWVKDGRTGEKVRRRQPRFDVRYRVDGHDFRYGFDQKGWAESFAQDLRSSFANGWLFDPAARRFVDPASQGDTHELTIYDHARDYVARKWRLWQPATRPLAQRDLARACLFLVRDDAPRLSAQARVEADAYLRNGVLTIPAPEQLSSAEQDWDRWFLQWSLPLRAITDRHLHAFLDDVRTCTLDGQPRELAAACSRGPLGGRARRSALHGDAQGQLAGHHRD